MNNDENAKDSSNNSEPIANRKLSIAESLTAKLGDLIDPRKTIPLDKRLAKLTPEQKEQLQTIEDKAITNFVGMIDELEAALGMLRIGHHFGWKVIYMVHSKNTVRKYEEILDIKVREIFPERGPSAGRSVGLTIADKFSNFWKVVSGEIKIDHRREII